MIRTKTRWWVLTSGFVGFSLILAGCLRPASTTLPEWSLNTPSSTFLPADSTQTNSLSNPEPTTSKNENSISLPAETPVQEITVTGPLSKREAEISGLAWYKDNLIILPQYPGRFGKNGQGAIFTLPKDAILAFLDGKQKTPLSPLEIPFDDGGLSDQVRGFEGFEALAFLGENGYLTVEAKPNGMMGYLVQATMSPELAQLTLKPGTLVPINPQSKISNLSDEALMVFGRRIITFYEANGEEVNPQPVAHLFDLDGNPAGSLAFPNLEYRLTDVTQADANGRFWGINFFFIGDQKLKPIPDPLTQAYGTGITHSRYHTVERLVEFQFTEDGITLSGSPPIQLQLIDDAHARNWEGIARLDERGFLIASDKFPQTILGFVPTP